MTILFGTRIDRIINRRFQRSFNPELTIEQILKNTDIFKCRNMGGMRLQIIRKNAVPIEKLTRNYSITEAKEEELIQLYFKKLGDTRNYYSHYKLDKTGVLESVQMSDTINVLKATIISIFMSHTNIDPDLIRQILVFDSELNFETMCLQVDGEQPFKHPSELNKTEKIKIIY